MAFRVQIDEWLAQGYDVLVNGSRGYLAQARRRYPDLLAVLLGVKPEVLRQRLLARGRKPRGNRGAPGAQRRVRRRPGGPAVPTGQLR